MQPPPNEKPISALIVRQDVPSIEGGKLAAIRITDASQLATLEAFFPDYRRRPTSRIAGAWIAGYVVYFDYPMGHSIRVTVSENENSAYWTVGQGDFQTRGDFRAFVDALQDDADSKTQPADGG